MPRPKLCGGWVSQQALHYLGGSLPADIVDHPFRRLEIQCGGTTNVILPEKPLGVFVDRAVFDEYLLGCAQKSGVAVRYEKVTAIREDPAGVVIETGDGHFRATGAIIAAGANSRLIQTSRPGKTTKMFAGCLEQRLPSTIAQQLALIPGTARLMFGDVPSGLGWLLHHGNYLLLGIGCPLTQVKSLKTYFRRTWEILGLSGDLIAPRGHLLPRGGQRWLPGTDQCLPAGDSAGFVDAFSGEGIAFAIRSGQLAAQALLFGGRSPAVLYRELCRDEIMRPLRQSRLAADVFYRLSKQKMSTILSDENILKRFCSLANGQDSYCRFIFAAGWSYLRGYRRRLKT